MLAELCGWSGTIVVLVTYLYMTKTGKVIVFHYGNVVGSVLLGISEIHAKAWPALFLTLAFGVIGLIGVIQMTKKAHDSKLRDQGKSQGNQTPCTLSEATGSL